MHSIWGHATTLIQSCLHARGGRPKRGRCPPPTFAILDTSGVAQWLACWAHNPKVRGSKPRSAIAFSASSSATACSRASHPGVCTYPRVRGSKPRSAMALWASRRPRTWRRPRHPGVCACDTGSALRCASVPRGHKVKDGAQWHQQRSGAAVSVLGS